MSLLFDTNQMVSPIQIQFIPATIEPLWIQENHNRYVYAWSRSFWFTESAYSDTCVWLFTRWWICLSGLCLFTGPDKGAHYHELFLRSKRHLAFRIRRVKIKGQGARKPANPKEEPDFYSKPFLPPEELPTTANANANAMVPNTAPTATVPKKPPATHPSVSTMLQQLQQQQLVHPLPLSPSNNFGLTAPMLSYLMAMGLAPTLLSVPPSHAALLQHHVASMAYAASAPIDLANTTTGASSIASSSNHQTSNNDDDKGHHQR